MNLQTQDFDRSLLELYHIGEMYDCLPALCRSDEYGGGVSREAAGETGLVEGTPVCGGMFDIDACAVAMDVMQPERLCTITGTWSINEYPSFTPVQTGLSTRNSLFCLPGLYLVEESSPTSAGNLDWFIRCFMQEEQRQGIAYKAADAMVETLPAEGKPGAVSAVSVRQPTAGNPARCLPACRRSTARRICCGPFMKGSLIPIGIISKSC